MATTTHDPYDAFRLRILSVVGQEGPCDEDSISPDVIETITLFLTDPAKNADKFYKVWIQKKNQIEYQVSFSYGRRGDKNPKHGVKYTGSLKSAEEQYRAVVREKKGKGYTEDLDGGFR